MASYLERFDALAPAQRWGQVRQWLLAEPLPFFAELRARRPILVMPELTLATTYADCSAILRNHAAFGVDLYVPKQGEYWMAQDDTAAHWRDKSVMKAILDREDIPRIREFVAKTAAAALAKGAGKLEVVHGLTRAVPLALVETWFGYTDCDRQKMFEWSYWNQQDAFHNQPFDSRPAAETQMIIDNRKKAGMAMAVYLVRLTAKRAAAVKLGMGGDDPTSRLLKLSFSGALKFDLKRVVLNTGGLLIGAVETTNHATVNALEFLLSRPDILPGAVAAAKADDPARFDGYVFEALRFKPAFPYFFRTCHTPFTLSGGTPFATEIAPGTTVLAVTQSAMFDAAMFKDPETFNPERPMGDTFTFGQGIHECLGRAVGGVMIPEIARQVLRLKDVHPEAPPTMRREVPEGWTLAWAA